MKANDLCVAIMTEPFIEMDQEQAENVMKELEGKVLETVTEGLASPFDPKDIAPYAPSFRGKAHYSEGTIKLWCEDQEALDWLRATAARMQSPHKNSRLVVKRQRDIPRRVRAALFIPNYDGKVEALRKLLACQNRWVDVQNWSLYEAVRQVDGSGQTSLFLNLGIPADDVPKIAGRDRRVSYMLGSVYIRYLGDKQRNPLHQNPPEGAKGTAGPSRAPGGKPATTVPQGTKGSSSGAHFPKTPASRPESSGKHSTTGRPRVIKITLDGATPSTSRGTAASSRVPPTNRRGGSDSDSSAGGDFESHDRQRR